MKAGTVRGMFGAFMATVCALMGCTSVEECEPEGFGTQCRSESRAICAGRPERNGGGSYVQTSGCHNSVCSEHYGARSAVCLPKDVTFSCSRLLVRAVAADSQLAFSPDGHTIAVANKTAVEVGPFPTGTSVTVPTANPSTKVLLADIDQSGEEDLLVANKDGTSVAYRTAAGFSTLTKLTADPYLYDTADLDGDGRVDVVTGDGFSLHVIFGGPVSVTMGLDIDSVGTLVSTGDLDGDGKPELVVVGLGRGLKLQLAVFSFGKDRTARRWKIPIAEAADSGNINGVTIYGSPHSIAVTDMDGDGMNDVVVGSLGYNLALYHGGEAGFAAGPTVLPFSEPSVVVAAAGGGIVAAINRSPVIATQKSRTSPIRYVAAPSLGEAVVPIATPGEFAGGEVPNLYRGSGGIFGACK